MSDLRKAPDDKSGEACWTYLVYDRGMWVKKETCYKFPSFADACIINKIIQSAYEVGEADGYAACEEAFLNWRE